MIARLVTAILLSGAPALGQSEPQAVARDYERVVRDALCRVRPAIVRIETIGGARPMREGDDARVGFRTADGPTTGVVWSGDGLIVTSSFNFLRDPSIITVALADGRRLVARLVARDHAAKLALLKVDAMDLPAPQWAQTSTVRVGQRVVAAGFGAGGTEPAISLGIVSALQRANGQAIQTDAKTSPVNYGGPLFDLDGRVLGVCVPLGAGEDEDAGVEWYDSGIGFAVHADHLGRRMSRLAAGESLRRGVLGVFADMRDPVVGGFPAPESRDGSPPPPPPPVDGVRLIQAPRGPAAQAGLQLGDVITRIDDAPTRRLVDFRRALALRAAGDAVNVTYRRGEQVQAVSVRLVAPEELRGAEPSSAPSSSPSPR